MQKPNKHIVMHFSTPPSVDDIEALAQSITENAPKELKDHLSDLEIVVDDFPDTTLMNDLQIEDDFELLSYHTGNVSDGMVKRKNSDENILYLYRRPILDAWCEGGESLDDLLAQIVISELCQSFDIPEERMDDLITSAQSVDYAQAS